MIVDQTVITACFKCGRLCCKKWKWIRLWWLKLPIASAADEAAAAAAVVVVVASAVEVSAVLVATLKCRNSRMITAKWKLAKYSNIANCSNRHWTKRPNNLKR